MLCSLFFIEAKCTGVLIDAEAKTKKDDLMVNDYIWKNVNLGRHEFSYFQSLENGI